MNRTSEDERNLIRFELNCAVLHFIEIGRPVYLEQFGIIYPESRETIATHIYESWYYVRPEAIRTLRFEKCDDTVGLPGEILSRLVQTRELSGRMYARLPLALQIRWTQTDLQAMLGAVISHIKQRTVRAGHSSLLSAAGDFYALHNRQGNNFPEWYAGADIFLKPRYQSPLSVGKSQVFDRPILENAWEIPEAAYGFPIKKYRLSVPAVLADLGYTCEKRTADDDPVIDEIPVAVFAVNRYGSKNKDKSSLFYCTDGLRKIGFSKSRNTISGTEVIFQEPALLRSSLPSEVPSLAAQAIVMGWILMHGSKSGTLKTGAWLSSKDPLGGPGSKLSAVLVNQVERIRLEHISKEGPFHYMNIVGITADEANVLKKHKKNHLLSALETRGLGQVTQPARQSVFARTEIEMQLAMAS